MVKLRRPRDRAWSWLGVLLPGSNHGNYRVPCDCERMAAWGSDRCNATTEAGSFVVVSLRYVLYRTFWGERGFWVGQCERCERVYWGLADSEVRRHRWRIGEREGCEDVMRQHFLAERLMAARAGARACVLERRPKLPPPDMNASDYGSDLTTAEK